MTAPAKTDIEWSDYTVNFWWGCTKKSPACDHCYAERWAKFTSRKLFGKLLVWGRGKPRFPRLEAARIEALKINDGPWICDRCGGASRKKTTTCPAGCGCETWHKPRVFVNSMSDWLDDEVPIEWLAYLLETVQLCPNVNFQLLTKRPENWKKRMQQVWQQAPQPPCHPFTLWLVSWLAGKAPDNVWIGATAEDQTRFTLRYGPLSQIPALVRFWSMEPLLGPIDFTELLYGDAFKRYFHWVICGGESGQRARPMNPRWAKDIQSQCENLDVPFLFKQWGDWLPNGQLSPLYPDERSKTKVFDHDGEFGPERWNYSRAGKDRSGRWLDGTEYNGFPKLEGRAA